MTHQPPPMPLEPPTSWWQRWALVIIVFILSLPVALGAAFFGIIAFGIAGAGPDLFLATVFWLVSAGALGAGVGAVRGPAWRIRLAVGTIVAVVWFIVGRFVLFSQ